MNIALAHPPVGLAETLGLPNAAGIDDTEGYSLFFPLLQQLLGFNPVLRLSAEAALRHPFFTFHGFPAGAALNTCEPYPEGNEGLSIAELMARIKEMIIESNAVFLDY